MQRKFVVIAFIAVISAVIFAFDANTAAPTAIAMVTVAATAVVVTGTAKERVPYATPAFTRPVAITRLDSVLSSLRRFPGLIDGMLPGTGAGAFAPSG